MPQIHFHHKDGTVKIIDAQPGLSIMEVAVKNKIVGIEGACGGSLACATCHVYVHPDWWDKVLPGYSKEMSSRPPDPRSARSEDKLRPGSSDIEAPAFAGATDLKISDDENDMLDLAFDLRKNSRLSCQIIVRDDLDGLILALPGSKPGW